MKHLCLLVAQEEWEKVEVPPLSIEFNLGKDWPHNDQLNNYTNKVLRILPADPDKLQQLYWQLSSFGQEAHSPEERKEQYRVNIICSLIQWSLQEKLYLALGGDQNNSVLANKLSRQIDWLAMYGIEAEDFTRKIGDCLFDNIAAQLPGGLAKSQQLRQEIVQFMQEHGKEYSKKLNYKDNLLLIGDGAETTRFETWEHYLACMRQSQVWATKLEIHAAASKLDCPIVLLTINTKPKIYNPEGKNIPLLLHHLHANHFEACIPFKGLTLQDVYHAIETQDQY